MSVKQDGAYPRTAADLERRYAFGQTFADVYSLISDAQKAANDANNAVNALDSEEIFNRLTGYGKLQGVFRDEADHIYINASYIKGEILEGDDLKVAAANITGKLTATQIDATNLKVNAANITGTLSAGSVSTFMANVTGEFIASKITSEMIDAKIVTVDAAKITGTLDASKLTVDAACVKGTLSATNFVFDGSIAVVGGGYIGYVSGSYQYSPTDGIGMKDASETYMIAATGRGAKMNGPSSQILCAGSIHLDSKNDIKANGNIIATSDRRAKTNIQYNVGDYLNVFDALKPCTFVWIEKNDKRKQFGMIAQDVEENLERNGVEKHDFAPLCIDEDGKYGLCYDGFIPLLIAKVQQLDAEVKELRQNG